jgi:hypothetical protein
MLAVRRFNKMPGEYGHCALPYIGGHYREG